mmetsp:Transcript_38027/g.83512  ORF Transcript_38027/g.83512 Transcript_38027/m.83512 type:complete len:290 (+) Transcript_38027:1-870(+)
MSAAAEWLATWLAEALGTRVARLRVVAWGAEEFALIKQATRSAPAALGEHAACTRRHLGGNEFVGLLEFLPGISVQGKEAHDRLTAMGPEPLRHFWRGVGRLIALDALINNLDRVPLLWNNEGNTGNLLLLPGRGSEEAQVLGIDQAVTAIVEGPGRDRYLQRLQKLASAAFRGPKAEQAEAEAGAGEWTVAEGLARTREAFEINCLVVPDSEALFEGIRAGLERVAAGWQDGTLREALEAGVAKADEVFASATVDVGTKQLPLMRDFVAAAAQVVTQEAAAAQAAAAS